jgi:soluble lytic murein transglycosylase-like protein
MGTRSIAALVCAGVWLTTAMPSRAQIASYVDEHGKLVFVNAEPPAVRHAASARRLAAGTQQRRGATQSPLPSDRLERLVREAAERNRLDPALVKAVVGAESGGNPGAVSRKGALGLMQLIPTTAERFGVDNPFDPAQNVEGGARYLRSLLDRYNGNLDMSLAAYNAGETAVERSGGVPNYRETRAYVRKVTDTYFQSDSGHSSTMWTAPSRPIRPTVDEQGRTVFTNE